MKRRLELSVDPEGLPDWSVWEATREFLQNWKDNTEDSTWEVNPDGYVHTILTLTNKNTKIPRSCLLVGNSSKRDDEDSIGRHGDGLKSAMAVMVRSGLSVNIFNGGVNWWPTISYSDTYGKDVLVVEEREVDNNTDFSVDLQIRVSDWEEIKKNCLFLEPPVGEVISTSYGDILKDEAYKGKIFCGGLYVTTLEELDNGYDFPPSALQLDRDRKAVDSFDVKWITKEMWREVSSKHDDFAETCSYIVDMVSRGSSDTEYLRNTSTPASLKAAFEAEYEEKFEGKYLAESHMEAEELKAAGNYDVVYLGNNTLTKMIKNTEKYQSIDFGLKKVSLSDKFQEWADKYIDNMPAEMYDELQDLISELP